MKRLLEGSVQLWTNKIEEFHLQNLWGKDIYFWDDIYDSDFLGYMAAVIRDGEIMDKNVWIL